MRFRIQGKYLKNLLVRNHKKQSCDVWYVASPNNLLLRYQMMPLGSKMAPPRGSTVLHRVIQGKSLKIFLSKSIKPRALIFVMQHHLIVFYQDCSNYAPGVKIGPAPGVTSFIQSYTWKILKNLAKKIIKRRDIVIPGVQLALPQGSPVLYRVIHGKS